MIYNKERANRQNAREPVASGTLPGSGKMSLRQLKSFPDAVPHVQPAHVVLELHVAARERGHLHRTRSLRAVHIVGRVQPARLY